VVDVIESDDSSIAQPTKPPVGAHHRHAMFPRQAEALADQRERIGLSNGASIIARGTEASLTAENASS
jgi:hypothetical protein